jgi:hypothetical protein
MARTLTRTSLLLLAALALSGRVAGQDAANDPVVPEAAPAARDQCLKNFLRPMFELSLSVCSLHAFQV